MNTHAYYEDLLPSYAAGQLDQERSAELQDHLATCEACRADLDLWQAVGMEITAGSSKVQPPAGLAQHALASIHAASPIRLALAHTLSLLRVQVFLVRSEMWPASAIIMALGIVVTFLVGKIEVIRFIAPLVAAASLAAIFGPEHDPAFELTLATPTSPWKVLLARMTIVHGYNLVLALACSLFLLALVPPEMLWNLILGWLGPMTFLSALALLLSLWIGTTNSVAVAYALWLIHFPRYELALSPASAAAWAPVIEIYRHFWASPGLLIGLGLLLLIAALFSAGRSLPRLMTA